MAALYEGYTLCGLNPDQNNSSSGIDGIEEERDSDHVIVTDSNRSVTLYKVSDQKPLGSWTVKQAQTLTCPAVFNSQTNEYVAVSDHKVIRIWKEGDLILDKTFKATVKADIWKVHGAAGGQPVVLFRRGAVRQLEHLLSAPQQPIEDVLAEDEAIRWSAVIVVGTQQFVLFTTELGGENYFYLQKLNPHSLHKYHLEKEEPGLLPLSVSASYKDEHISLLCLYPNGFVYRSVISVRGPVLDEGPQALPRNRVMSLPVGEGLLKAASALFLDDSHIAAVGAHHPSAGADFLCIWNINFQTLQAGKEMGGKIYGQLWSYANKFFIPHGKRLSVIPFTCHKSSLASALGKLRQTRPEESRCPTFVPSWNNTLHEEKTQLSKTGDTRKTRLTRKRQPSLSLTAEQVLELVKTAPAEEVQKEAAELLSRQDIQDLQVQLGKLVSILVCRSQADPTFYTHSTFVQLVQSKFLCHSVCPDLLPLALEKKDYFLCQICLLFFPDIPEVLTCTCLKAFMCLPDVDAEKMSLEPDSVSFMDSLITRERCQGDLQNGFSLSSRVEDNSDTVADQQTREGSEKTTNFQRLVCPVGSHKAALLNAILQTAYSDTFLLPHLKDLCSQHVLLFLRYLQFLYLNHSQDTLPQTHSLRAPSLHQIMDWICMMLDAHFTVLVMSPEAKGFLLNLHSFVRSQVKLFSELGKIEGSLLELQKMKMKQDVRQYSIEVIEIF